MKELGNSWFIKIDRGTEIFENYLRSRRNELKPQDFVLGGNAQAHYDRSYVIYDRSYVIKMLTHIRSICTVSGKDGKTEPNPAVENFIKEALSDPTLSPGIKQRLDETRSSLGPRLDRIFFYGNIPDETLLKMLVLHAQNFNQRAEDFKRKERQLKEEFIADISGAQESGLLRIPINLDQIREKIAKTSVFLIDPLRVRKEDFWYAGIYDTDSNVIFVDESSFLDNPKATKTHELFHSLGGTTLLLDGSTSDESSKEPPKIYIPKVGLRIRSWNYTSGERRSIQFYWLDEAVTEWLSTQTLQYDRGIYEKQRTLADLLRAKGRKEITMEDFVNAYFEEFDLEAYYNGQDPIPAWRSLIKNMNSAYGKGFLVKLDFIVTKRGLDYAIELMGKNPQRIDEAIKEFVEEEKVYDAEFSTKLAR